MIQVREQAKYEDLLKHPLWQRKRLEVFERDGWSCLGCGSQSSELQVHHLKYPPKGRMPWEIESEWLESLCRYCHEQRTAFDLFATKHRAIPTRHVRIYIAELNSALDLYYESKNQTKPTFPQAAMAIHDPIGEVQRLVGLREEIARKRREAWPEFMRVRPALHDKYQG